MTAAVMLALAGVTFTYLRTASQYASSSHNLNTSIAESSRLDAAVNDHEGQSHSLWQGSPVDKPAYVRAQNQITAYFASADRDLRGAGEHSLVTARPAALARPAGAAEACGALMPAAGAGA